MAKSSSNIIRFFEEFQPFFSSDKIDLPRSDGAFHFRPTTRDHHHNHPVCDGDLMRKDGKLQGLPGNGKVESLKNRPVAALHWLVLLHTK